MRDSGSSSGGSKGETGGPQKPATPRQDAVYKALATLQSVEAEQALATLPKPGSAGSIAEVEAGLRGGSDLQPGKKKDGHVSIWEERALQASSSSGSEEDLFYAASFQRPSHPGEGEAFQRLKERRWSATQEGRKIPAYPSPGEAAGGTAVHVCSKIKHNLIGESAGIRNRVKNWHPIAS